MRKISRRTFLQAAAGTTAVGLSAPQFLDMKAFSASIADAPVDKIPTYCNGCSTGCPMISYVKNGRLWKVEGHPVGMKNFGTLCARAHGVATDLYNKDRVRQPMKRGADGTFQPISWDQAFKEIAEKLSGIIDKNTGNSVAWMAHGGKEIYGQMFLDEIGASTYITHYSTCFTAKSNAWDKMVANQLTIDIRRSNYMLFAGRNYGGAIIPAAMKQLTEARAQGRKIIVVDPRLCELAKIADEWIPIRPGTDLAFFLAIAHTLISENLYNKTFVQKYVFGFEEFWAANRDFSADKAATICDIPAAKIREIARNLAKNAPASFLDPGYHGLYNHYTNSTQIAQANVIVNALLGNFYQHGGLMPTARPIFGSLKLPKRLQPEKGPRADGAGVANEYPTAEPSRGIAQHMPELIANGKIKAVFFYHYNPLRTAPDPEYQKGIAKAELVVSIPIDWNESSYHTAHYILPESYFLERMEAPRAVSGNISHDFPQVVMRMPAVKTLHDTKPLLEIMQGLTKAMKIDDLYPFTVEDEIIAALAPLGIDKDRLKSEGCIELPTPLKPGFPEKEGNPACGTFTGKVEFSIGAFKLHGRSGIPTWIPPLVSPKAEDEFRLIHGKQPWHSHSQTNNTPYLLEMTKSYQGTWMWMNRNRAEKLQIKNGDLVTVESKIEYPGKPARIVKKTMQIKVTDMLYPECVWMPSAHGCFSPNMTYGYGNGANYNDFAASRVESLSGSCMVQEVIVKIRKGAV